MSGDLEIGAILKKSDRERKCEIEWTIPDIFSYIGKNGETRYKSPCFEFQELKWHLGIWPNGQNDLTDYIPVVAFHKKPEKIVSKAVSLKIGIKQLDDLNRKSFEGVWVFGDSGIGYEFPEITSIKELREKMVELAPLDTLTLACTLSLIEENCYWSTSRLISLSDDLADLFFSKSGCDVKLKVQQKEIPVHSIILAARSSEFKAMFEKKGKKDIVEIDGYDSHVVEDFVYFLYSSKYELNQNNVFGMCTIANEFCIKELVSACIVYIMKHLWVENFCDVAIFELELRNNSLAQKIKVFFYDNFSEIMNTEKWLDLLESNNGLANDLLKQLALEKNL